MRVAPRAGPLDHADPAAGDAGVFLADIDVESHTAPEVDGAVVENGHVVDDDRDGVIQKFPVREHDDHDEPGRRRERRQAVKTPAEDAHLTLPVIQTHDFSTTPAPTIRLPTTHTNLKTS